MRRTLPLPLVLLLCSAACSASSAGSDTCPNEQCGDDTGQTNEPGGDNDGGGDDTSGDSSSDDPTTPPGGDPNDPNGPATETCNGVDDDGDGDVDEDCTCVPGDEQACYSGPADTAGVGRCAFGVQACDAGGEFSTWGECVGDTLPIPEVCDGAIDDDCDGVVDNGCGCVEGSTRPCGSDQGECVPGAETCVGGTWTECTGGRGPTEETCNFLDDDCNGVVDDGCPICREVEYSWDYPDGCTTTTRGETATAPADFWPGQPLFARLMTSYFDDCGTVGNLSLPVTGCAEGQDSNIPAPTDIASLNPDQRSIPVTIRNLACFAYQARFTVRWCVEYVP